MNKQTQLKDVADESLFTQRYRRYVLVILSLGYVVNAMHREALGIVLQAIKSEFGASDTQLGLLGGFAFALFYATMGIPIAAWADRSNRRNLLALAIALWSTMTAMCGLAISFGMLLLARIGTAVGEAGGSPPSHSMISDYFPARQRGTALSIYALGIPIGTMLGDLTTGWLNELFGWRMAFLVEALPGLVIAALVWLTVLEPPRGHADRAISSDANVAAPPVSEALKYLAKCASYRHLVFGTSLTCLAWYSGGVWNPSFLIRTYALTTGAVGSLLAVLSAIGVIGTFFGGYLADKLSARTGNQCWYMWLPGWLVLSIVPFQFFAYLSPRLSITIPCFCVMGVLAPAFLGPAFAVTQSLAPLRMRSVAVAILLLSMTTVGMGLGPLIIGLISDRFAPVVGAHSVAYGLAGVGVTNVWAALHFFRGARSLRTDIAAAPGSHGTDRERQQ